MLNRDLDSLWLSRPDKDLWLGLDCRPIQGKKQAVNLKIPLHHGYPQPVASQGDRPISGRSREKNSEIGVVKFWPETQGLLYGRITEAGKCI